MSLLLQQVLTHLTQDPTAHPSSLNVTFQAKHFGTVLYTREKQSPYDRRNSKNFQIYVFYRPQGKVMFPRCLSFCPLSALWLLGLCSSLLATWSLFLLFTARSVRILLECFLVYVIFLRGREAMVSFQHNILAVPAHN